MKVAIIGAGLAGLSCAGELMKNGIVPTIFEKKGYLGEDYLFSATTLRILDRTYRSSVRYLNQRYGLNLKAFSPLREIIMISPGKTTVERGRLGYIYMRGEERDSLERQLAAGINAPILYDSYVRVNDVKNDFDYVIAATGDETAARELGVWTTTFDVQTRIALVLGSFRLDSAKMWVNNEYARVCYGYLSAHSPGDARLLLSVNNVSGREVDYYWNRFLIKEEIPYRIMEIKDIEYSLGYVSSARIDNIYLVGNGAGLIDDFLGFGAINAIESGILAARSIINGFDYNELLRPMKKHIAALHEFRKAINEFGNEDYDRLISFLGLPFVKQLIYNNPLAKVKTLAGLARVYNLIKHAED
ncbi:MAG: NAD(P)/FAD-dependent oxidoreductase [Bacillota bacterium]